MKLTKELKEEIDSLPYTELLRRWRYAPVGDKMFQGESGKYFGERMKELRKAGVNHVKASKEVGWDGPTST